MFFVLVKFLGIEFEREKMGDILVVGVFIIKVGKFMSFRWNVIILISVEGEFREFLELRFILLLLFLDWGVDMLFWDLYRCFLFD